MEKASAPNGFTALSDKSNSITFFPIKPAPKKSKLSGISVFNLETKIF